MKRSFFITALLILVFTSSLHAAEQQTKDRSKDSMKMVYIPAGEFKMGSTKANYKKLGVQFERPIHEVYIDAFYMDEHEVTNEQYCKFLNATKPLVANLKSKKGQIIEENRIIDRSSRQVLIWLNGINSRIKRIGRRYRVEKGYENYPVVCVYWHGADLYAKWVGGRLPTEAEWEKAARGGWVGKQYPNGDSISHDEANYKGDSLKFNGISGKDKWKKAAPVKSFVPNGYSLYDMAGNVWEWCSDWWGADYYQKSPKNNPTGPKSGNSHVLRGGCWLTDSKSIRCAARSYYTGRAINYVGFRVVVPSKGTATRN